MSHQNCGIRHQEKHCQWLGLLLAHRETPVIEVKQPRTVRPNIPVSINLWKIFPKYEKPSFFFGDHLPFNQKRSLFLPDETNKPKEASLPDPVSVLQSQTLHCAPTGAQQKGRTRSQPYPINERKLIGIKVAPHSSVPLVERLLQRLANQALTHTKCFQEMLPLSSPTKRPS